MEHKGTKTIETNRLLLRKFCVDACMYSLLKSEWNIAENG